MLKKKFKKYGSYNTDTGELSHIYDDPRMVSICFHDGAVGRDSIEFVEVEIQIKKKIKKR